MSAKEGKSMSKITNTIRRLRFDHGEMTQKKITKLRDYLEFKGCDPNLAHTVKTKPTEPKKGIKQKKGGPNG
jgi:hypothetical protein